MEFQFTHPGKGATDLFEIVGKYVPVSIHAPWEGCDLHVKLYLLVKICFNSRTLGRVRLLRLLHKGVVWEVSIHAPWEGCDLHRATLFGRGYKVSIHAPWEGCDILISFYVPDSVRFNSRTLGRVRLTLPAVCKESLCFNSRTLGRVRQLQELIQDWEFKFQFTHPGKGATPWLFRTKICKCSFNSRTLGRVRHSRRVRFSWVIGVSIHAPWEGCDEEH